MCICLIENCLGQATARRLLQVQTERPGAGRRAARERARGLTLGHGKREKNERP